MNKKGDGIDLFAMVLFAILFLWFLVMGSFAILWKAGVFE
jgi:hypothetical protein|tara:strand:+ start:300 stop:419 length:120 start_codon:yes stop_codon:yes gene_type:complete